MSDDYNVNTPLRRPEHVESEARTGRWVLAILAALVAWGFTRSMNDPAPAHHPDAVYPDVCWDDRGDHTC